MRDYSRGELEAHRPAISAKEAVDFCLQALFSDVKHHTNQEVVRGLSFEELIGALLLARDALKAWESLPKGRR